MANGVRYSWRRTVIAAVLLLSTIAILAAVLRIVAVTSTLRTPPSERPEFSAVDQLIVQFSANVLGIEPGTSYYAESVAQLRHMADKFVAHSNAALMHLIPGVIFVLLAPLQFSSRLRARRPRVHRWSGRALVLLGMVIGLSGLFFGVIVPTYGNAEAITIGVFGSVFLFCLMRAVVEIRRRNVSVHREWMIRAYAAALAIAMIRIVAIPVVAILEDPKISTITSFWLGWLTTLAGAELWIRYTRAREPIALPHSAVVTASG